MYLSIIIVSWNAKKFLSQCLRSVISETRAFDTEIIVVDNGSTDGSPEFVQKEFSQVKLINNYSNLGFAKANNIGIKCSTGRYIFLINSDVIVLDGCFDRMIEYMNRHAEIGILGPRVVDKSGKTQRSCMEYPTIWNIFCRTFALDRLFPKSTLFGGFLMNYWLHDTIRSVDTINACFWMIRREALDEVGPLDENFFIYAEDIDMCKRFRDNKWKVVFFPEAEVIHFGGASSANAPIRFYIEMQKANLQLWRKHHGKLAQVCFLSLTWIHHIIRTVGQTMLYITTQSNRAQTTLKLKRSVASIRWLLFHFNKK